MGVQGHKPGYDAAYYRRNRDKRLQQVKDWAASNPEKRLNAHLRRYFGITKADYDVMVEAQGGRCAICSEPPENRRLFVDHDHETMKVRSLLCLTCNGMLGYGKDDPDILRRGAEYLEKHGKVR